MMDQNISTKPFVYFPRINELFSLFDLLRDQNIRHDAVSCALITGESGSGKSEIASRYVLKNPVVEEEERTFKPVVWYELKSVSNRKDFIIKLLIAIGDPQLGRGAKNEGELYDRLILQCRVIGLELLILDEIQVIIERRSQSVISVLADLFKDLIKDLGIPIVFMGMPWSRHLIDSNKQLRGRISYRHVIPSFRVSMPEYLNEFRKLLKKLSDHYQLSEDVGIYKQDMALKIFSFSSGNLRDTVILVRDAYTQSCRDGKAVSSATFKKVLRGYGVPDEQNQFIQQLERLQFRELVCHSDWNFGARTKENSIVDGKYVTFGVSTDRKIYSFHGAA
ncbi:MAG: hypothetical protein JWM78_158 [Verrucomicrobiaceae bacterium]|nr:hypothetical protein [Verrucomicrobiaceae bacterium]